MDRKDHFSAKNAANMYINEGTTDWSGELKFAIKLSTDIFKGQVRLT